MADPLSLGRMHVESLYERDADGAIVRIREPEPEAPPCFHLVRTREGNLPLLAAGVPEAVAARLLALAAEEPPLSDPLAPPVHREAYVEAVSAAAPVQRTYAGPAFVLPAPAKAPEGVVRISRDNAGLLQAHYPWALPPDDAHSLLWAAVEEGAAVALCFSAREPSAGIEAGVFTVEAYRGRGHARRVVAAWAHEVAARGGVPLYSTTWENIASLRVAQALGAELYATDFWLR